MLIVRHRGIVEDGTAIPTDLTLNESLSYAARGLLFELLSHAPECNVNADDLSRNARQTRGRQLGEGRRQMRALFAELEAAGFMRRTRMRETDGSFYTLVEVFDTPHDGEYPGPNHGVPPIGTSAVVYVVGEADSSVVKIGTTANLSRRIIALQRHSRTMLDIRWSYSGNAELEYYLHRVFRDRALGGEWFDFGDLDPVAEVTKQAELFYLQPANGAAQ